MKAYITIDKEAFNSITMKAINRIRSELAKLHAIQAIEENRPKSFTEYMFGKPNTGTQSNIKVLHFLLLEIQEISITSSFSTQVNIAQDDMMQLLKWATVK